MLENPIQNEPFMELDSSNSATPEQNLKSDKIANILGAWSGAIVLTFFAAILLGYFFTFIPTIVFKFTLILKCWAGIWGLMFARGALKNKMF